MAATAFLVVAGALMLLCPSDRPFDPLLAAALVASYAIAASIRVFFGGGSGVPTQLILVPMLFLMPSAAVPALVAAGLALAATFDVARGLAHRERVYSAIADSWHAVGPATVFYVAGEPSLDVTAWPVIAAALVAQSATDMVSATTREWLGRGIAPTLQLRVLASVHALDACLTPIGLLAAMAGTVHRAGFAMVLPLLALLAAFAADRRARIEQAGQRVAQLHDERLRLEAAIRRIGDAFASKLDREALAELAACSAIDTLDADRASALLRTCARGSGSTEDVLDRALVAAAQAMDGQASVQVADDDEERVFAMAAPLGARPVTGAEEVLAVARRARRFSAHERDVFAHLVGQARIAMENAELHEQLRRQAVTDELTGLANHRRFQEILRDEIARARRVRQPVALALFDIDNFKSVNDTHGHQQGDAVLRQVAAAIAGSSRSTDKPARYGGEELAVVLPDTDADGALVAAEAMRRAVEALAIPLPDGSHLRITVSGGVAVSSPSLGTPAELVSLADAALYQAKRSGKNRTISAVQTQARVTAREGQPTQDLMVASTAP